MIPVVLASQSPSRRQILTASGIDPIVIVSEVDEPSIEATFTGTVGDLTTALSEAKARAVVDRVLATSPAQLATADTAVIIAGDSLLEHEGQAIGKPGNAERTREVWADIAGAWTALHTGHTMAVLRRTSTSAADFQLVDLRSKRSTTSVLIGEPTPEELDAYIATEEPFHVAGALTIDGYGGAFVESLAGDHLTVLGLSLPVVRELVSDAGLFWPDLWSPRG
ncbi:MAG: Maf family protein [Brevibacterium aurantiacum]|uniref:Nucleoside triphosphate pyrophosphatase n=1 Tax=Brevibacterium aurantiacum TaxID=273384 RepID=A0A1D7W2K6_BREAU|nr:Maf family protein [Brevibacterium aurantiacum]MDN5592617.1 Maf family protein [Brevibacterium sp.]AOP53251.1 Septum formation protein Maf [Brevibacterium aurantiacum]AZL09069.1 maf protein [Brevibacterium aurantiacum]AZL12679.1 maf protein [Brevibacterium aurantiacum]MDN5608322.1 Maf family protein [Brevibacterium sp.]